MHFQTVRQGGGDGVVYHLEVRRGQGAIQKRLYAVVLPSACWAAMGQVDIGVRGEAECSTGVRPRIRCDRFRKFAALLTHQYRVNDTLFLVLHAQPYEERIPYDIE